MVGALLLALSGSGPLAAADREHQQMIADIRMLQEQNQQLQLMLNTLAEALKTMTSKIDDQSGVTRKAFADQKVITDTLAGDIRIVREKVDDANVRLGSLTQELDALRQSITQMSLTSAAPPPGDADPNAPPPAPVDPAALPAPVPTGPIAAGQSPQRMYDVAWSDYTAGQWALAIQGFETYLKQFTRSPLAPDAQNFIGQAQLMLENYEAGVAAFEKVITDYPDSDKVSEAYYNRGLALERLEQTDRARDSYETVTRRYPNSQAATLAKQALDRMSRARR